jgi:hypothetical protein
MYQVLVMDLRIVDDQLWQAVSARLDTVAKSPAAIAIRESRFWEKKRPKHLLTGLVCCGSCGNPLTNVGRDYLRCTRADKGGTCSNNQGVRRSLLEKTVLTALQKNLMHPDLVREFISAFQEEMNKERNEAEVERKHAERKLAEVNRQLDGLITAIAEGFRAPGLQQKLDTLESEKARLAALVKAPPVSPVRLHPGIADSWSKRIGELKTLLENDDTRSEAIEIIRSLVERINVHPRGNGHFELEIVGEIAKMVEVALEAEPNSKNKKTALHEAERRSVKVVAGARFELTTFRL